MGGKERGGEVRLRALMFVLRWSTRKCATTVSHLPLMLNFDPGLPTQEVCLQLGLPLPVRNVAPTKNAFQVGLICL